MAHLLDLRIQANNEKCHEENEQPHFYPQNELKTCDIDGGPWFEQYKSGIRYER